ncbi:SLC13 family permease [Fangia hongkongensis]|uniref:SLC13 family permease n=1 Tax=Fangia hongkongensis TaxID=270495 RepID=UPI002D80F6C1|nr:SLC13 family permease [Fangia hongkongensis]
MLISASVRKIGRFSLPLWFVMSICALVVIASGNISIQSAFHAIDFATIFYLIAVFFIGSALQDSKILDLALLKHLSKQPSQQKLLFLVCFSSGLLSALLLNDTIAVIGIGILLPLIQRFNLNAKPYLYTLAFSSTIGSLFSPIGNPQNLLIANTLSTPFNSFFSYLFLPSLITLYLCHRLVGFVYRKALAAPIIMPASEVLPLNIEKKALWPIMLSMASFLVLIIIKILFTITASAFISLTTIALIACIPILFFYPKRINVIKHVDWHSILFFIAMFIFMHAVWMTEVTQSFLQTHQNWLVNPFSLIIIGFLLSQVLSNVPAVMLLLPLLSQHTHATELLMALAVGSTLSGNISMLGAASNVIIFQYAEKAKVFAFRFLSFFTIGFTLSLCFFAIYYFSI